MPPLGQVSASADLTATMHSSSLPMHGGGQLRQVAYLVEGVHKTSPQSGMPQEAP